MNNQFKNTRSVNTGSFQASFSGNSLKNIPSGNTNQFTSSVAHVLFDIFSHSSTGNCPTRENDPCYKEQKEKAVEEYKQELKNKNNFSGSGNIGGMKSFTHTNTQNNASNNFGNTQTNNSVKIKNNVDVKINNQQLFSPVYLDE